MKLNKDTRKELREAAAKHESLLIPWPKDAPECQVGRKYPLSKFSLDARLLVEKRFPTEKCESGWEAKVSLNHDPVRTLYGLSPVRNEDGDLETEPERVPHKYEELLAEEGKLKTIVQGNMQRQKQATLEAEQRLADARRRGRTGTVRYLEKLRAHHERKKAA